MNENERRNKPTDGTPGGGYYYGGVAETCRLKAGPDVRTTNSDFALNVGNDALANIPRTADGSDNYITGRRDQEASRIFFRKTIIRKHP